MTTLSFSTLSLEYIPAQVTVLKAGQPYNPTSDTVQMAFTSGVATATPPTLTWYPAVWETANNSYFALCLVGPGAGVTTLTAGIWTVWVQVTDSPEVPVKNAGQIQMF